MPHKSEDFKISAVEYYLTSDKNQLEICEIFNCSTRSLMRWVTKYEFFVLSKFKNIHVPTKK